VIPVHDLVESDFVTIGDTQIATQAPAEVLPGRRLPTLLGIGVIALAFCMMVCVVWWRSWFEEPITPVSVIYILGDSTLQDAMAILDKPENSLIADAGQMPLPLEKKFGPGSESGTFGCRIAIPAGKYSLRIMREGRILWAHPRFELTANAYWPLDLRKKSEKGAT
jgi:hypothetical protein